MPVKVNDLERINNVFGIEPRNLQHCPSKR